MGILLLNTKVLLFSHRINEKHRYYTINSLGMPGTLGEFHHGHIRPDQAPSKMMLQEINKNF